MPRINGEPLQLENLNCKIKKPKNAIEIYAKEGRLKVTKENGETADILDSSYLNEKNILNNLISSTDFSKGIIENLLSNLDFEVIVGGIPIKNVKDTDEFSGKVQVEVENEFLKGLIKPNSLFIDYMAGKTINLNSFESEGDFVFSFSKPFEILFSFFYSGKEINIRKSYSVEKHIKFCKTAQAMEEKYFIPGEKFFIHFKESCGGFLNIIVPAGMKLYNVRNKQTLIEIPFSNDGFTYTSMAPINSPIVLELEVNYV